MIAAGRARDVSPPKLQSMPQMHANPTPSIIPFDYALLGGYIVWPHLKLNCKAVPTPHIQTGGSGKVHRIVDAIEIKSQANFSRTERNSTLKVAMVQPPHRWRRPTNSLNPSLGTHKGGPTIEMQL